MGEEMSDAAPSVFASRVEVSNRSTTSSGLPFKERAFFEPYDYRILEDQQRFHDVVEVLRLKMIEALRTEEPGVINRWRLGTISASTSKAYADSVLVGVRSRAIHEGIPEL